MLSLFVVLVVLTVVDCVLFVWTLRRNLAALSMTVDRRGPRLLRGSYALVAEAIAFVLLCGGLAIVNDPGIWVVAGLSSVLPAAFAALVFNVRGEAWYRRLQWERVDRGLPPRSWWDWRTD